MSMRVCCRIPGTQPVAQPSGRTAPVPRPFSGAPGVGTGTAGREGSARCQTAPGWYRASAASVSPGYAARALPGSARSSIARFVPWPFGAARWAASLSRVTPPHLRPRRSAPWQWRSNHSREAEDSGCQCTCPPPAVRAGATAATVTAHRSRTVQVGDIEVLAGEVQGVAAVPGTEFQHGAGPGLTEHRGGVDGRRGGLLSVHGGVGAAGALPVPLLGPGRFLRVRRVLRPLVRVRRQPERAGAAAGQWLCRTCAIPALPARQTRAPVSARLSVSKETRIVITRPAGEPSAPLEGGTAAPRRKRAFRRSRSPEFRISCTVMTC